MAYKTYFSDMRITYRIIYLWIDTNAENRSICALCFLISAISQPFSYQKRREFDRVRETYREYYSVYYCLHTKFELFYLFNNFFIAILQILI